MINKFRKLVTERGQDLADQAAKLRAKPVRAARNATAKSAERIKALKDPIRAVSRSGVKLTAISHNTAERLIELQAQVVTSALTDAAVQLERAARAENVKDLVRGQSDVLRATRDRIVNDITQAVTILKDAGGDARKVATHTYASVTGKAEAATVAAKKKAVRKAKRAVRKAPARKK
jgi:phasin family protein